MAAQVGNLQVRIGADITGLKTGMSNAQREVRGGVRGMQKQINDLQLSFKEVSTFAGRSLRTLGGIWAAELGAGAILRATDAFKQLTAQLRLATAQYGSFEQANKDVRAIAETTRSDLLSTAELYAALQRNSDQFGASQEQVARVTQTVAEAFKVSGATADEASNATRQLVQAFQSGRLQGDEFRSILENAPRLARLLADSLGTTIGKLRTLSKEGDLTADKLVRAFSDKRFTAGLDEEFQKLPVTFDQAMSQVYNAAVLALGEFDRGGQFSTSLANFITDGAHGFETLGKSAYHFGEQVADAFEAVNQIRQELGSLRTDGIGAFIGLENATFSWRDALSGTLGVIDGVANAIANLYNAPGNLIRLGMGQPLTLNPSNLRGGFLDATNKRRVDATRQQIMGRTVNDILAEFGKQRQPPPFHPEPAKAKKAKKPPRDRSADEEFQFQQQVREANLQILQAKKELAGTNEQRAQIDLDIIKLEHDTQQAEIEDKVRRAKRDFADKKITAGALQEIETQAGILSAQNDRLEQIKLQAFTEARLARAEQAQFEAADQQRSFALDGLRLTDQLATTQADHRRIQLQILDAEIAQRRLELEHEKQLAIRNGATADEIKVIQDKIDHLDAERAQGAAQIHENTLDPLEAWEKSVPKTAADINEALKSIEVKGLDGLTDAITGVLRGTESLKSAFHDLAASILADLIQMTIKMLLFRALTAAFGGGGNIPAPNLGATAAVNIGDVPVAGFATGGSIMVGGHSGTDKNLLSLNGMPIARVSYGERINIANDNAMGGSPSVSLTFHNDFRGADPSAVASINARLNQMQAELPGTIVSTMNDARERFLWRGK